MNKPILKTKTRHLYWIYSDSFSFPEGRSEWESVSRVGRSFHALHGGICPVINSLSPGDEFELEGKSVVEIRDHRGRILDTESLGVTKHRFRVELYTKGTGEPYKIAYRID